LRVHRRARAEGRAEHRGTDGVHLVPVPDRALVRLGPSPVAPTPRRRELGEDRPRRRAPHTGGGGGGQPCLWIAMVVRIATVVWRGTSVGTGVGVPRARRGSGGGPTARVRAPRRGRRPPCSASACWWAW